MSEHQRVAVLGECDPVGLVARFGPLRGVPGYVVFVGTGLGGPLQLTLASLKAIAEASVIIVGPGVNEGLISEPEVDHDPDAVVLDAGAEPDLGKVAQLARSGLTVVWLVAGDPLEDADASCQAARLGELGCRIDMVPGLSKTSMALTSAGICLRSGVWQLTPFDQSDAGPGSLVAVGGVEVISSVAAAAQRAGLGSAVPALVSVDYATSAQRTVDTTLGDLSQIADQFVDQPTAVVVGAAAARNPRLNWFEAKPLFGWRVLVPRTKGLSGLLERRLEHHGAVPEQVPTTSVEPPRNPQPMDRAIQGLVDGRYQWIIFNSVNAVRAVTERLADLGLDSRAFSGLRIAAVGSHAVQALRNWGIIADLVPEGEQRSEALAAEFPVFDDLLDPINRILIPRADIAVDALVASLNELGWEVEDVVAYRTVRAAPPPAEIRESIKAGRFDAVVFTSASTVRNMVGIAGKPHADTIVAAIGPATKAACEEHGLRVDVIPQRPGPGELVDALAEFAVARRAAQIERGEPTRRPSQRSGRRRR